MTFFLYLLFFCECRIRTFKLAQIVHQNRPNIGKVHWVSGYCRVKGYTHSSSMARNHCQLLYIFYDRSGKCSFWVTSANMVSEFHYDSFIPSPQCPCTLWYSNSIKGYHSTRRIRLDLWLLFYSSAFLRAVWWSPSNAWWSLSLEHFQCCFQWPKISNTCWKRSITIRKRKRIDRKLLINSCRSFNFTPNW